MAEPLYSMLRRVFCGILNILTMTGKPPIDFASLYAGFHSPIADFNCGERCAPYNERGVPFCCDTRHAVPTAYLAEWDYLQAHTSLWHLWQVDDPAQMEALRKQTPAGQVLIECQGYQQCQRNFRSLVCRAFPFFPYVTKEGQFIGLSYYWEYEDRCWVISHLKTVTPVYRAEFVSAYEAVFNKMEDELENFRYFSGVMRRIFGRQHRAIPLLHRNGFCYKITPRNGRMRCLPAEMYEKFGPYKIAAELPFPGESFG